MLAERPSSDVKTGFTFIPTLSALRGTNSKNNTLSAIIQKTVDCGKERRGNTTAVKLKQVQYIARYFGLKNKPSTWAKRK